jgi:hypothetical protein
VLPAYSIASVCQGGREAGCQQESGGSELEHIGIWRFVVDVKDIKCWDNLPNGDRKILRSAMARPLYNFWSWIRACVLHTQSSFVQLRSISSPVTL